MRNSAKLVLGVVAMGLPLGVRAGELDLSLSSTTEYRTNEFRSNRDRQGSAGFVLVPRIAARSTGRRLRYSASYTPKLRGVLDTRARSEIDHSATLNSSYAISRRTQLSLSDSFSFVENTRRAELADADVDPDPISEVTDERTRTLRNQMGLSVSHAFSSRLGSSFSASHTLRNSNGPRISDITVLGGRGSLNYAITPRFSGNFGGAYSRTFFADNDPSDDVLNASRSTSIQGFLGASYRLSPTLQIRANGGPVLVERDRPTQRPLVTRRFAGTLRFIESPAGSGIFIPDPSPNPAEVFFRNLDSCSPIAGSPGEFTGCVNFIDNFHLLTVDDATIPPDFEFESAAEMGAQHIVVSPIAIDDRTYTFFAEVGIDKTFNSWNLSLTYRRTENPNSGLGATSVVDVVTARAGWTPSRKWGMEAHASWNQRRASVEQVSQTNLIYRASGVDGSLLDGAAPGNVFPVAEFVRRDVITSKRTLDVMQYNGSVSLTRSFSERLRATLRVIAVIQRTGSQVGNGSSGDYEDYRFLLGITYSFAPFRF